MVMISRGSFVRHCLRRPPHGRTSRADGIHSAYRLSSVSRACGVATRAFSASQRSFATLSTKFVGAHISASGGCLKALDNAAQWLGPRARAFAFFVRPRLSWKPVAPIEPTHAQQFRERLRTASHFDASKVVVHGSYILNFGSHDAELRRRSVDLMVEEVLKCAQLGIPSYVFHPGSCTRVPAHLDWMPLLKRPKKTAEVTDTQREEAIARESQARVLSVEFIGECMAEVLRRTQDVTLCVENMCGQGNVLGRDFHELRGILDSVVAHTSMGGAHHRVGVCIDTCHAHASGMKVRTAQDCEETMASFDAIMGDAWIQRDVLKVLHVNDSMDACGSRKDRHENIGLGRIGLAGFEWFMNSPRFDNLPMILETPRRGKEALREKLSMVDNDVHRELLKASMGEDDTDENEIDLLLRLVRT
jgi:AP endonuclease 1